MIRDAEGARRMTNHYVGNQVNRAVKKILRRVEKRTKEGQYFLLLSYEKSMNMDFRQVNHNVTKQFADKEMEVLGVLESLGFYRFKNIGGISNDVVIGWGDDSQVKDSIGGRYKQ